MFFTVFALSVVVLIIIIFLIRKNQKKKLSEREIEREEKEGIID